MNLEIIILIGIVYHIRTYIDVHAIVAHMHGRDVNIIYVSAHVLCQPKGRIELPFLAFNLHALLQ